MKNKIGVDVPGEEDGQLVGNQVDTLLHSLDRLGINGPDEHRVTVLTLAAIILAEARGEDPGDGKALIQEILNSTELQIEHDQRVGNA